MMHPHIHGGILTWTSPLERGPVAADSPCAQGQNVLRHFWSNHLARRPALEASGVWALRHLWQGGSWVTWSGGFSRRPLAWCSRLHLWSAGWKAHWSRQPLIYRLVFALAAVSYCSWSSRSPGSHLVFVPLGLWVNTEQVESWPLRQGAQPSWFSTIAALLGSDVTVTVSLLSFLQWMLTIKTDTRHKAAPRCNTDPSWWLICTWLMDRETNINLWARLILH